MQATQQIASLYGATFVDSDTLLVYVWLRDGAVPANVTLLSPDSPLGSRSTWSARLNSTCHEFASLHLGATQKDFLLGVDGYSLLLERGFPLAAASAYLSNKSRSTILPTYRTGYGAASIFSDFLQLQLGALWPENATTTQLGIELMGDAAFMDAIQGAVERDMGIGDGVVLPIAFALLALTVRCCSWWWCCRRLGARRVRLVRPDEDF